MLSLIFFPQNHHCFVFFFPKGISSGPLFLTLSSTFSSFSYKPPKPAFWAHTAKVSSHRNRQHFCPVHQLSRLPKHSKEEFSPTKSVLILLLLLPSDYSFSFFFFFLVISVLFNDFSKGFLKEKKKLHEQKGSI